MSPIVWLLQRFEPANYITKHLNYFCSLFISSVVCLFKKPLLDVLVMYQCCGIFPSDDILHRDACFEPLQLKLKVKQRQGNELTCQTHQRGHSSAVLKEQVENIPLEKQMKFYEWKESWLLGYIGSHLFLYLFPKAITTGVATFHFSWDEDSWYNCI